MSSENGLNILIVEDEVSIRSLMEMEFQDMGYHTVSVSTLSEAENILQNDKIKIDLCIFDLHLPDGDGLTLLAKSKELLPNAPVILMTGHGNKATVIEALKLGAYDYIEKPFSIYQDLFPVMHRAEKAIDLQKENNSLNEQILHNSKLAALGELSATVLHDIRGPLSLIQVICEDMEEEASSKGTLVDAEVKDYLKQIYKGCDRIAKLADHLRGFARQDQNSIFEFKSIELLIDDSIFMVMQKIRANNIKVVKNISPEILNVNFSCIVNKFEQVLMNLLSNACDAMIPVEKKELLIEVLNENSCIVFNITDSGTGIPEDVQGKIFQNFFTTKSKDMGTGLGLNIVRNIVKEHKGEISFVSQHGKFTTFTIKVPLAEPVILKKSA